MVHLQSVTTEGSTSAIAIHQGRLKNLLEVHKALEAELAAAVASPSSTDFEINNIKKNKLSLKDKIEELRKSLGGLTRH